MQLLIINVLIVKILLAIPLTDGIPVYNIQKKRTSRRLEDYFMNV